MTLNQEFWDRQKELIEKLRKQTPNGMHKYSSTKDLEQHRFNWKPADENDGKMSNCCWAKIRLDRCSECHEHCGAEDDEDPDAYDRRREEQSNS